MHRSHRRPRWIAFLTIGTWLMVIVPANAYIDAGTTSVIFGAVVAAAMAVSMTVKIYWRRFVHLFKRDDDAVTSDERVAESEQT